MKLYRWYIGCNDRYGQRIPYDQTHAAIRAGFERFFPDSGYTNWNACGVWQGASEESIIVECIHDAAHLPIARALALQWADVLNQQCVFLTDTEVNLHVLP